MSDKRIYPIGEFESTEFNEKELATRLAHIRDLPRLLEAAVSNLSEEDIQKPYRDGSWKIQQLIHHVADSHMVAFIRTKLILTVDEPLLPVYPQDEFAKLSDYAEVPINHSLTILYSLHSRWTQVLSSVKSEEWTRRGYHPESEKFISLWDLLGLYVWHGRHHAMQIVQWRDEQGTW